MDLLRELDFCARIEALEDENSALREQVEDLEREEAHMDAVYAELRSEVESLRAIASEIKTELGYTALALEGMTDDRDALQVQKNELLRQLEDKHQATKESEAKAQAYAFETLLDKVDKETLRMLVRELLFS